MERQHRRATSAAVRRTLTTALGVLALVVGLLGLASPASAAADATILGSKVPAVASYTNTAAVELGVTFVPRVSGTVRGVRFYKGTANTGTHTGSLWSASGSRLAKGTFTGETASGWQVLSFSTPVAVSAGQTYVASYFAPKGRYALTSSQFASPYVSGDLTVPAKGGASRYGSTGFPSTRTATSYSVDVVFRPSTSTPAPSFDPGNPNGAAAVPSGMGLEDVSRPDHVVGNGTAASCTSAAVLAAAGAGGVVTFSCGASPVTITLSQTIKVRNSTSRLVLDGGGKVTLSGGGARRILYTDTCDTSLGSVSGNCLYAPQGPRVTVQNLTLADGNATNATYVSPGDTNQGSNGGGAIFQLGGRLKVVRSVFVRNRCATTGPDLGGGAIRVLAQHSPTPNDLDGSYAARNQEQVAIVQSTFGGASGQGNSCSNGGAVSGLRTPITMVNSLVTDNAATGCCANPAHAGTPGGGSGGAVYTDGDTYDLTITGSDLERNTAKAGGSAIFYVSNDRTGHLAVQGSVSRNNTYLASGYSPSDQHFENYPGIFYLGSGNPSFTGSTIQ